jgi:hypothetical protein
MATFSPSKRSYPIAGTQASGAIVFASLFILLGLGVGGFLSLHAYVHRSDPPASLSDPSASLVEIPAVSTGLRLPILPPQVLRAESTTAPSAPAAAPVAAGVAPIQTVSTLATLRARGHAAPSAAVPDNPAASEALSDNPYP